MGKLKRTATIPVLFCLSVSFFISGCPNGVNESIPSSEKSIETESVSSSSTITEQTENSSSYERQEINYPYDLSVQIIGSDDNGDSTIIRYKDTEILIDTSEGDASVKAVEKVIKEKKADKTKNADNTWDYVIFTHPDSDHIKNAPSLFKRITSNEWVVGHVIDFGVEHEENQESDYEKGVLTDYKNALKELKENSEYEYYSPNADQTLSERKTQDYVIDSRFKITILYNESYTKAHDRKDDNYLSVCCLFTLDGQKLLFTGDLRAEGEIELLKNHRELLKNVCFFKAGHHGSETSNTQVFVDWIRPAYVAITYNSNIYSKNKTDDAIVQSTSKFLKYTDNIYPTVVRDEIAGSDYLFGNCQFDFNGKYVKVKSEYNNGCTIKQAITQGTMTRWYWNLVNNSKINDEINTYFFDENITVYKDGMINDNATVGNLSYYNCTLVKYGHYDILIDCGSNNSDSKVLAERLKDHVVDGIIEYVIVSHYHLPNYSHLIGSSIYDEGVFRQFKIENIIDNDNSMTNCFNTAGTAYAVYLSKVLSVPNRISIKSDDYTEMSVCDGVKLKVYRGNKGKQQNNEDDYSLVTVVDYFKKQMVFVGDLTTYTWFNDIYGKELGKVYLLRFPSSYVEYNKMTGFDKFLRLTRPDVIIIGSPINHWNNNQYFIRFDKVSGLVDFLINSTGKRDLKVYTCGYISNNVTNSVAGDIDFSLFRNEIMIDGKLSNFYVSCCFFGGEHNKSALDNSYYKYAPDDIRRFSVTKNN